MGKIIRRSIAILLCVTGVLLLLIPAGNVEASIQKGDFTINHGVLEKYVGNDSDITIPLGVSAIGDDAFSGNNTLKSVYIPEGIDKIGYAAFENCKNLETVTIGNDLREIGQSAFSGCQSLNTVNIPRYVEEIGSGAFSACPSLSNVNIDPKNRNFLCLDGVIYTSDGKKMVQYLAGRPYSTYEIPAPVEEIGEFGFYGANMLTDVSIINGVKEIPEYTFLNCNGLNNVSIPNTVEAIRKGSFGGCPSLTALAIPASVRYIDPDAFTSLSGEKGDMIDSNTGTILSESSDGAAYDTEFIMTNNAAEDTGKTDLEKAVEQALAEAEADNNDSQSEGNTANEENDNSSDTEKNFTENLENLAENLADKISETKKNGGKVSGELASTRIIGGQAVFVMDPKAFKVYGFDINNAQTEDTIADSGNQTANGDTVRSFSGNEFDVIGNNLGHYGGNATSINIPSGVSKIGNRLFYKNKNITDVSLPDSVSEIGDFAFARSSVADVNIPDGVQRIGYAAFYNCTNLNNISIPQSVKDIELGALEGSGYMNNWKNTEDGNNYLIVGDNILVGYKGFGGSVEIPNGVKTIAAGVFEGNPNITSVTFPDSVTRICEDAFNGCSGLKSLELPSNLTTIEDRAFKDTSISSVIIPASVTSIGLGAFDTTGSNGGMEYVQFNGLGLPNATFKSTASRLSADNLRTNAFEGTKYAFVNKEADMNSGSIFSGHKYGFRGEVYTIGPETEDGLSQLELRRVTKQPDNQGLVNVDSNVNIDGKPYIITGVRESAFDEYQNSDWCDRPVQQLSITGNSSGALSSLVAEANKKIDNGTNVYNITEDSAINVTVDPSLGFDKSQVNAKIPQSNDRYNLTISKDLSAESDFMTAFNNRYGRSDNVIMQDLSIDMTDRLNEIPIHKMATGKMEISMPIPSNMPEDMAIRVATLDDNGLLEEVPSEVNVIDGGGRNISFVASHLSPYCIYYFADGTPVIYAEDNAELSTEKEIVEDETALGTPFSETIVIKSLNKKVGAISTNWIVAVIMFASAGIIFIYKPKKKTS